MCQFMLTNLRKPEVIPDETVYYIFTIQTISQFLPFLPSWGFSATFVMKMFVLLNIILLL